LSGGNDFALMEVATNWSFTRFPDLELRYEAPGASGEGNGRFFFWKDGAEVSSPFPSMLLPRLATMTSRGC
jgi:hypothetical protein